MGKSQRDKGNRFEREVVNKAIAAGKDAKRIPLSGASWLKGDVLIDNEVVECKKRANGFKQIYAWIEDNRYLIIGADRKEPLIIQRYSDWLGVQDKF